MKKLRRLHKFIISLCVVSSLFFMNIFSFSASANGVEYYFANVYTFGAPVSCRYESLEASGGSGSDFSGVIPLLNVFTFDPEYNNTSWVGSLRDYSTGEYDHFYQLHYYDPKASGATHVDLSVVGDRRCQFSFRLDSPVIFKDFDDLRNFNFNINFNDVSGLTGLNPIYNPTDYVLVCEYRFASTGYSGWPDFNFDDKVSRETIPLSSNSFSFSFFSPEVFNEESFYDIDAFYSSDLDSSFYVLLSAEVSVKGVAAGNVTLSSYYHDSVLWDDYTDEQSLRNSAVINNDLVVDNIHFSHIDWTDWLVNAVGGFMNFELVPGLSFAGMLGLLVGMSLFIVFLKVFAGG